MKSISRILGLIFIISLSACSGFLDVKPDIKLVVPQKIKDAELLLNDYTTLNTGYPTYGELGTDDYFLTDDSWRSISNLTQRNAYSWTDEPYTDVVQWQRPYKVVFVANQVIDLLSSVDNRGDIDSYARLLATAYFFRAFAFHQLAEVFCPAYNEVTSPNEQGIPLRLTPAIDENSVRASLRGTYLQIVADYERAISGLPAHQTIVGHPDKAAAYAGLARVYLDMGSYQEAFSYADSSVSLRPELIDFNKLGTWDDLPVPQFNQEVLFPAMTAGAGPMGYYTALVATDLYKSYQSQDLRKKIFFLLSEEVEGSYNYKGNYGGSYSQLFVGLTTSEVYLIKSEAAARIGRTDDALKTLNSFLVTRWKTGKYIDITESDPDVLLQMILLERRKELLFRGRRWSDLKRLNLEERFQKTLSRSIDGEVFRLEPNNPKYAFRLPEPVITVGKIDQNKR